MFSKERINTKWDRSVIYKRALLLGSSGGSTTAGQRGLLGGALLANAHQTSVGARLAQPLEHTHARAGLLLGDLAMAGLHRHARHGQNLLVLVLGDVLGGGELSLLLVLDALGALLRHASATREHHQLGLVHLQALHVLLQRLVRLVAATMVNRDANAESLVLADASLLLCQCTRVSK